jgi:hypothetical protein
MLRVGGLNPETDEWLRYLLEKMEAYSYDFKRNPEGRQPLFA